MLPNAECALKIEQKLFIQNNYFPHHSHLDHIHSHSQFIVAFSPASFLFPLLLPIIGIFWLSLIQPRLIL
jgi:hypothetical protein